MGFSESLDSVYQGTQRHIPEDNLSYYFRVCVGMYVCMLPTRVLTLSLISSTLYLDVKDELIYERVRVLCLCGAKVTL